MAEAVTGDAENTAELYKMMEDGQIESRKYLLEFARILDERARQGGAYAAAVSQAAAEQMRMNNQWNDWLRILESKGFEEGQASVFRTMATFMERLNPLIEMFAENWGFAAQVIRIPLGLLGDMTIGIEKLAEELKVSEGAILGFGTLGAMMLTKLTRKFLMFGAVLALVEDMTAFLTGRESLMGELVGDDADEIKGKFVTVFEELGEVFKNLKNRFLEFIGAVTGDHDLTWVEALDATLTSIASALKDINVFLGGRTRKEDALIKQRDELDPDDPMYYEKRRALTNQLMQELAKPYGQRLSESVGRGVLDTTGMRGPLGQFLEAQDLQNKWRAQMHEGAKDGVQQWRDAEYMQELLDPSTDMPGWLRQYELDRMGVQNPQSSVQPIEQRNEITIRLEGSGSTEEDAQEIVAQINNAAIRFAGGVA